MHDRVKCSIFGGVTLLVLYMGLLQLMSHYPPNSLVFQMVGLKGYSSSDPAESDFGNTTRSLDIDFKQPKMMGSYSGILRNGCMFYTHKISLHYYAREVV